MVTKLEKRIKKCMWSSNMFVRMCQIYLNGSTYNLSVFSNLLLLKELAFFFVVGASTNKGHDSDCEQNGETLNPRMSQFFFGCRWHFNYQLEDGAAYQNLKHKIIQCLKQQLKKATPLRRRLVIGSKFLFALRGWARRDTLFKWRIESLKNTSRAA